MTNEKHISPSTQSPTARSITSVVLISVLAFVSYVGTVLGIPSPKPEPKPALSSPAPVVRIVAGKPQSTPAVKLDDEKVVDNVKHIVQPNVPTKGVLSELEWQGDRQGPKIYPRHKSEIAHM